MIYFTDVNEMRKIGTTKVFKELSKYAKGKEQLYIRCSQDTLYKFILTDVPRDKEIPTITEVVSNKDLLNELSENQSLVRAEIEITDYRNKSTALVFKVSKVPNDFKVKPNEEVRFLISKENTKLKEKLSDKYNITNVKDDINLSIEKEPTPEVLSENTGLFGGVGWSES